jgi:serine/threonine protein kinase
MDVNEDISTDSLEMSDLEFMEEDLCFNDRYIILQENEQLNASETSDGGALVQTEGNYKQLVVEEKKSSVLFNAVKWTFESYDSESANDTYYNLWRLQNLRHSNLLSIEKVFNEHEENKNYVYTVIRHCTERIADYIQTKVKEETVEYFAEHILLPYMLQLADLLHYLHGKGYVYSIGALRLDNIYCEQFYSKLLLEV